MVLSFEVGMRCAPFSSVIWRFVREMAPLMRAAATATEASLSKGRREKLSASVGFERPQSKNDIKRNTKKLKLLTNCAKVCPAKVTGPSVGLPRSPKNVERFTILRVILAQGPC